MHVCMYFVWRPGLKEPSRVELSRHATDALFLDADHSSEMGGLTRDADVVAGSGGLRVPCAGSEGTLGF